MGGRVGRDNDIVVVGTRQSCSESRFSIGCQFLVLTSHWNSCRTLVRTFFLSLSPYFSFFLLVSVCLSVHLSVSFLFFFSLSDPFCFSFSLSFSTLLSPSSGATKSVTGVNHSSVKRIMRKTALTSWKSEEITTLMVKRSRFPHRLPIKPRGCYYALVFVRVSILDATYDVIRYGLRYEVVYGIK